jgi:hypothetical protein
VKVFGLVLNCLVLGWFLGATPALSANTAPVSESGSMSIKPATNATLSAVLDGVSSGRELELRLTDAPPITVSFVRYDPKRELLVYRQPEVRGEFPSSIERERIDQLRFVETVRNEDAGIIGFLVGAGIGLTAGYLIGSAADEPNSVDQIYGGMAGFLGGGAVGLIVGVSLPGSRQTGPVIWGRAEE